MTSIDLPEPQCVIYGLSIDGVTHRYVGLTTRGTRWRLRHHLEESGRSRSRNRPLSRWIHKVGKEAIKITILEEVVDPAMLREREVYWIAHLRTYAGDRSGGLNVTHGGDGIWGYRHTDETRAAITAAGIGRRYPARIAAAKARRTALLHAHCHAAGHAREEVVAADGRIYCQQCARRSNLSGTSWNAGLAWSQESRERMSQGSIGQVPWNRGRTASEREIQTNRIAQLTRYDNPSARARGRANLAWASHVRWHERRGRTCPNCNHCTQ